MDRYSTSSDIFALGVTALRCLTPLPWDLATDYEQTHDDEVVENKVRNALEHEKISNELADVIVSMIKRESSERITYPEIISRLQQ